MLEADSERAFHGSARDRLPRKEQRRRASGAVVVDVDDWDAGHAEAVEDLLTAGRIAEDVTGEGLLHVFVSDSGIGQGEAAGLPTHDVVSHAGTWLRKGDHACSCDEDGAAHSSAPWMEVEVALAPR